MGVAFLLLAAGLSGVVGALTSHSLARMLDRRTQRRLRGSVSDEVQTNRVLSEKVGELSQGIADERGHPELAPLVASYLTEMVRLVQRLGGDVS